MRAKLGRRGFGERAFSLEGDYLSCWRARPTVRGVAAKPYHCPSSRASLASPKRGPRHSGCSAKSRQSFSLVASTFLGAPPRAGSAARGNAGGVIAPWRCCCARCFARTCRRTAMNSFTGVSMGTIICKGWGPITGPWSQSSGAGAGGSGGAVPTSAGAGLGDAGAGGVFTGGAADAGSTGGAVGAGAAASGDGASAGPGEGTAVGLGGRSSPQPAFFERLGMRPTMRSSLREQP